MKTRKSAFALFALLSCNLQDVTCVLGGLAWAFANSLALLSGDAKQAKGEGEMFQLNLDNRTGVSAIWGPP